MRPRALLLVVVLFAGPALTAQTPRDAERTGTAMLTGQVVTDEADSRPVRLARVSLSSPGWSQHEPLTITDDDGRFAFHDLPAGRYTVHVTKAGYVSTNYGAKQPGGAGIAVVVASTDVAPVTIRLPHGAVLAGTVHGPNGVPMVGAFLNVYTAGYLMNGLKGLDSTVANNTFNGSLRTDDRGMFRIYGLRAGEYFLAARPLAEGFGAVRVSSADLDWAQRVLAEPGSTRPPAAPAEQNLTLAPVFYPGTTDPGQAVPIALAAGDERTDLDFPMDLVPTSTVSGTVRDADGLPPKVVQLSLVSTNPALMGLAGNRSVFLRADPEGHFTSPAVLPGEYVLAARGAAHDADVTPAAGSATGGAPMPLLAVLDMSLHGQTIENLDVRLGPAASISGRLVFEGSAPPPADLRTVALNLGIDALATPTAMGTGATSVGPDGTFTLKGVGPGRYTLRATVPGPAAQAIWTAKSALLHGVDIMDLPFEVGPTDLADVVVTFTDRPTELSGSLIDASGRPASDYFILVVSTDRDFWRPQTRRIQATRPTSAGTFRLSGLPAGEYYVLALTDLERNRMYSADYLEPLLASAAALKLTLADGEKKTQDFRIAAARSGGSATPR